MNVCWEAIEQEWIIWEGGALNGWRVYIGWEGVGLFGLGLNPCLVKTAEASYNLHSLLVYNSVTRAVKDCWLDQLGDMNKSDRLEI